MQGFYFLSTIVLNHCYWSRHLHFQERNPYLDFPKCPRMYSSFESHKRLGGSDCSLMGRWEWTRRGRRRLLGLLRRLHVLIGWWLLGRIQLPELEQPLKDWALPQGTWAPWAHSLSGAKGGRFLCVSVEAQEGTWLPRVTQLAGCHAHFWIPDVLIQTKGILHYIYRDQQGLEESQMRSKQLFPAMV